MTDNPKKVLAAVAIIATIGFTGFIIYKVVKSRKTKSGDPKKNSRNISIVRA